MSTLLEQVAEPQPQYNPKTRWQYNTCDYCGGRKKRYARACRICIIPLKKKQRKREVERAEIIQPNDESIRHVALTMGMIAIISAHRYEEVMKLNWGTVVGRNGNLYASCGAFRKNGKQKSVLMHNFLTGLDRVDHINGNGLDNRDGNLRPATQSENCRNRRKMSTNTSGYIGICWDRRRRLWRGSIYFEGKNINLGWFSEPVEGAPVRDVASLLLYKEFAKLNFPERKSEYLATIASPDFESPLKSRWPSYRPRY